MSARGSGQEADRRVIVLGAGRMGGDIALAFALGGWRVDVFESDPRVRERVQAYWPHELARLRKRRALARITLHERFDALPWRDATLVVESVFEDLALKRRILGDVERRVGARTLIATNTSSLRIADVTAKLARPGRAAGLHFMMPSHVMPAVEITRGPRTARATLDRLIGWMEALGKVPIVLQRDIPGMLINRIQHAMYREIYHLLDSGICRPEDVDRAVRFGFGFRYQYAGPVLSRDIHGLPVHLTIHREILPTLHNGTRPAAVLARLVAAGHRGVTSGRGFYKWDRKTVTARLDEFSRLMEDGFRRVKRLGAPSEF